MSEEFYLPRTLNHEGDCLTEEQLLKSSSVIIVLAEPGAGKSELLKSLGLQLGVKSESARLFKLETEPRQCDFLVLDGLDEVARLNESGLDELIFKARKNQPKKVIFASRSSEWEESNTHLVKECFATDPYVTYLNALSENEQQAFFGHLFPEQDFSKFLQAVDAFDLAPLLGNPLFLSLFSEAFVESQGNFVDKRQVFHDAVERLAFEANKQRPQRNSFSSDVKIEISKEAFTVLLLSGAVGISIADTLKTDLFPRLQSIVSSTRHNPNCVLDSRLFVPTDDQNSHRPVHRVVEEYCAAEYLAQRIDDPCDPLSLRQCFALIAPNSVVREELRGLLGWLAAVGGESIQRGAIQLAPYAVLANGDPSRLTTRSKIYLLHALRKQADDDPYFRGGDVWRSLNISGFFSADLKEPVRELLFDINAGIQVRALVLDLLEGAPAATELDRDLTNLMLDVSEPAGLRRLAANCLVAIHNRDHKPNLGDLIARGDAVSLELGAMFFRELGSQQFGRESQKALLLSSAVLYSNDDALRADDNVGSRLFITRYIHSLDGKEVAWLLDELSKGLQCTCGAENRFECHCRDGISKIIGHLLDQFFESEHADIEAPRIYHWIRNLNFHNDIDGQRSKATDVLQKNHSLRQELLKIACDDRTASETEEPFLNPFLFHPHIHSGIKLQAQDSVVLARHAFTVGNMRLWRALHMRALPKTRGNFQEVSKLRHLMRQQAAEASEFMRHWYKLERESKAWWEENQLRWERKSRKSQAKQEKRLARNRAAMERDRDLVESGKNLGFLGNIATLYLHNPEEIERRFGNLEAIRRSFINCRLHLQPHLPSLAETANLHCTGRFLPAERILMASSVEIFRETGSLETLDQQALEILRANIDLRFDSVQEDEWAQIRQEADARLFQNDADKRSYLIRFVKTQLDSHGPDSRPEGVHLLRDDPMFSSIAGPLALEWLDDYRGNNTWVLECLFDAALKAGRMDELVGRVQQRTHDCLEAWSSACDRTPREPELVFWCLRHLYFVPDLHPLMSDWLSSDQDLIFEFESLFGGLMRTGTPSWPRLSAQKIRLILESFIDDWPAVHLPTHWGSDSPREERAYRLLNDLVWQIANDHPESSLLVLDQLQADGRFECFREKLKTMKSGAYRTIALRNYSPPSPSDIFNVLHRDEVVTVEGLRQLVLEELESLQGEISGGEFDTGNLFYNGDRRVGEVEASKRVADRLSIKLQSKGIKIEIEDQVKSANRCDISAIKMFSGKELMLPIEAKGQWHEDLYTAASMQLDQLYAIHPAAQGQGIYLIFWFGSWEKVEGRKRHGLETASQLKAAIEELLDHGLKGRIDVFVLDVSRG
ncbi:hypothetical protein [Marinobacter metalliresistant]|uniref:ATP-binding protein n=1 Tax=Marinobacter metalliresistant TaxID=2961995 RepID=A0ABZ2VZW8_9GAMM